MKRFWLICLSLALSAHAAQATEIQEVTSPGGITAWLVEEHALPLVAIRVSFRGSGYAYDPTGKLGRATLAAGMLTEGAGDLDSRSFNEALEARAIEFNVSTDDDLLNTSVSTLSENNDLAFSYLGMALTSPRFDSEAIERTKRQTLSLIVQQRQQPGYLAEHTWRERAFGGHPYSNPQLGISDDVEKLGKNDLTYYLSHYVTKENLMIAVVGDITPAQLGQLLDKHLGNLPDHYMPDSNVPAVTVASGNSVPVVVDKTIPQTLVVFGTNGLLRNDPDYYAAYVMNQILGGGGDLTSRLAVEVREKRGLAYTIASMVDPLEHASTWQGQFGTRNEKVGEALGVLHNSLKEFVDNGPSDQELADAKQFLTGSFVLHLDSNAKIADFMINMELNHLGRDYLDKRNAMISAVSRPQVMSVARRLINPDKLLIVMVGKPQMGH
jgi:zinc protease